MTGMDLNVPLAVIGVVRSQYTQTELTPIQSSLNRTTQATIEVSEQYADGLAGLAGFDYAWLLTWLHRPHDRAPSPVPLRQVPFLLRRERRTMGIFATRGPRRVNSIGLSLVGLIEVARRTVTFAGVDLLDGTPVLDIKPYVTRFDRPPGEPRCGWVDDVPLRDGTTPAGLSE